MSFTKYRKLIFLIFYLFILSSCKSQNKPDCLISMEEKLAPKVNELGEIGEIINLKDSVNCFEWDSLIVMPVIYLIENSEKELGLKLPLQYNHLWTPDSQAILLFVKDNKVMYYIVQNSGVDRESFENAKSIKSYSFLELLGYNGNEKFYIKIPREKAVFITHPMIYHENGQDKSNPKYGLGIRVK